MSESIVKMIDHAVLHPMQTDDDVRAACEFCAELGVASVCVKPSHVPLAVSCLHGSGVMTGTAIGFPHGGTSTENKVAEVRLACQQRAVEVDMVVNIGKVLSGGWEFVENDIKSVVDAAGEFDVITKVILETGLVTDDEKIRLCKICELAGAAFVKTSTGFGYIRDQNGALVATGATEDDVKLMREACSPAVQVKASGGIRTYEDAARFVALGATRIGTSSTQAIAAGQRDAQAKGQEGA